jgi:zinc D-Ala-D-Ala carboxypeptidase
MIELKHFTINEFDCQYSGENEMKDSFLQKIDQLRHLCNFPFVITSGYRSADHPIEAEKDTPGTHAQGIAADIQALSGDQKYILVKNAMLIGFSGIGIADSFIHVDIRATTPVIWTYN